jgi:hypothetical protein
MNLKPLRLISLFILLTACTAPSNQFVGNAVAPEQQIVALQSGGASTDLWQTFDIKIDYQYKRDGNMFEISGAAELTPRYEMLYENLRDLRVFLFFLNDKAHVLEANLLARNLTNRVDESLGFTKFYKVPPGTESITFGYDGYVMEAEQRRGGGGLKSFYMLPLGR